VLGPGLRGEGGGSYSREARLSSHMTHVLLCVPVALLGLKTPWGSPLAQLPPLITPTLQLPLPPHQARPEFIQVIATLEAALRELPPDPPIGGGGGDGGGCCSIM
jgi:hypothetical protein